MPPSSRVASPSPALAGSSSTLEGPGPWAAAASRSLHPANRGAGAPASGASDASPERRVEGETSNWMWSVASGLAGVTVPWELRHDDDQPGPTERRWDLVLSTPTYEVWAICWPVGTGLEMHDHGPSAGAFCLVAGELVETVIGLDGATEQRHWGVGQGALFEPGVAHQVVNEGTAMATTVHVYSPPLSSMTFYDRDHAGVDVPDAVDPTPESVEVAP